MNNKLDTEIILDSIDQIIKDKESLKRITNNLISRRMLLLKVEKQMSVDAILHKNGEICSIDMNTITWSEFSKNVWYGRFGLNNVKYINADLEYNHKNSISVHCCPIIWTKDESGDFVELKDLCFDDFLKHPDHWYVELEFKLPDDLYVQSYTITPLKFEYEIWAVTSTFEEYLEHVSNREAVEVQLIEIEEDKNGD
jgi:hypothetical protein